MDSMEQVKAFFSLFQETFLQYVTLIDETN